jgi:hypothetical protein
MSWADDEESGKASTKVRDVISQDAGRSYTQWSIFDYRISRIAGNGSGRTTAPSTMSVINHS